MYLKQSGLKQSPRSSLVAIAISLVLATACNGESKEQAAASTAPANSTPLETPSLVAASPTESPAKTAKATGPKFIERYDPASQTFEKAVELEGGDSISVAEWNRLWDPNDPRFKEQVGSRYSRFAGDGEFTSSGEVTVSRPNRNKGVAKVTHCSKTSGQLRRRG